MPKRTNDFQQLVAYIYSNISPGAKVTESAELNEQGKGAKREVDILIEQRIAGTDIKIAIECRDRSRRQTLNWIDELIGKYTQQEVNKKIAVSSSGFSEEARQKALAHNIDLLTVTEAKKVDWAARIAREFFTIMTHHNMLLRVGAFGDDGTEWRIPRSIRKTQRS